MLRCKDKVVVVTGHRGCLANPDGRGTLLALRVDCEGSGKVSAPHRSQAADVCN